jgi:hypothetical protein
MQCRAAGAIEVLQELEQSQMASIREVASNALSAMSQVESNQFLLLTFPSLPDKNSISHCGSRFAWPGSFPSGMFL